MSFIFRLREFINIIIILASEHCYYNAYSVMIYTLLLNTILSLHFDNRQSNDFINAGYARRRVVE